MKKVNKNERTPNAYKFVALVSLFPLNYEISNDQGFLNSNPMHFHNPAVYCDHVTSNVLKPQSVENSTHTCVGRIASELLRHQKDNSRNLWVQYARPNIKRLQLFLAFFLLLEME